MKHTVKTLFFAVATLCLSISCLGTVKYEGNDPNNSDGHEIVTLVQNVLEAPYYYAMFDNGKKAFVSQNVVVSSLTFPSSVPEQLKGERRMAIDYNYVNEKHDGYDLSIKIVGMQDVTTELLQDLSHGDLAVKAESHTAPIQVLGAAYSKNLNYMTLRMRILRSEQTHFQHSVFLVTNKQRIGTHQSMYESTTDLDSYLWLELYHDSDTDGEHIPEEIYASYKIDTDYLGIKEIKKYKGLKIICKDLNTRNIIIYDAPIL